MPIKWSSLDGGTTWRAVVPLNLDGECPPITLPVEAKDGDRIQVVFAYEPTDPPAVMEVKVTVDVSA